jgi:hypothetical protein
MTVQNIFNAMGLIIGMAGAYVMYHFTPKADSRTFLYRDEEELMQVMKKDRFNIKMVRYGMLLLCIAFLFQFAALFA